MSFYRNSTVVLATKHKKERMIARPMQSGFGAHIVVPANLDTDLLGTFTGEIQRVSGMNDTVVQKAFMGMKASGIPLGMASEGSFGPHPYFPFVPHSLEMMVFVDAQRELKVFETLHSPRTNYRQCEIYRNQDIEEIHDFLNIIGFPQHAVIVRPKYPKGEDEIDKGVMEFKSLQEAIIKSSERCREGIAQIQTDMRAHLNPTRQKNIRQLAFRLVRRLKACCKACGMPGWGKIGVETGLPCRLCAQPTEQIYYTIFGCANCDHTQKVLDQKNADLADPTYCSYCNP